MSGDSIGRYSISLFDPGRELGRREYVLGLFFSLKGLWIFWGLSLNGYILRVPIQIMVQAPLRVSPRCEQYFRPALCMDLNMHHRTVCLIFLVLVKNYSVYTVRMFETLSPWILCPLAG